jgi:multicomponent K+:H+ antiporter subunit A
MVKAGIFLMARLNPALGGTDLWFSLLTGFGMATMLIGAYLGLKQNDLKALLAYSTISQLGVMMALIGQDIAEAFKALVIAVLAHALYKSALFMVAGIVDHETGTRDLSRLGGLRKAMPATFVVAAVAGLSMAGLPPLFGFLAKETLLVTATHPYLPQSVGNVMALLSVAAGALLLAQAGLLVWDTFLGQPRDRSIHAHEAPRGMWLAPAIPAALSLLLGLAPEPQFMADFLANAAQAAYGGKVKVSLALWTGINVPLLLSAIAISAGLLIFAFRARVRAVLMARGDRWGFQHIYEDVLKGIDQLAAWATRLQGGKLRTYLSIMLGSTLLLLAAAALLSQGPLRGAELLLTRPGLSLAGEVSLLRLLAIFVVVGTAVATIFLQRDFAAIIALSAAGLGMALFMVLEPAPDVALVQVVVDILSTVILVLAITRLPRIQRHQAHALTFAQSRASLARDALIALGAGAAVAFVTLQALVSRPRPSLVTPYYEANAKALTGAKDIVGAIVVDFRGYDTLIEITVFAMAGLGIYTLLRYASRTAGDQVAKPPPARARVVATLGIGGQPTSAFVHALAYATLPLAMVIGVTHMMYGHNQPGDGFTAGVIIGLGIAFWYVVFGYDNTKQRLTWLRPRRLIGAGLLLAIAQASIAALVNGSFFSPVDFGAMIGLPLPEGFTLSTSFLFEVSICLAVLGSASLMLDTLGHPGE